MSKIMQDYILFKPELDSGLDDCSCEELLPPDYQEWLDSQKPTLEEKEAALESSKPVF